MQKTINLTIAIPTYNRGSKLKKCISYVLAETCPHSEVEIIVFDNASTDNTESYMRDIREEHPEIRYYRNESNCEPDRNFLNCYEQARGRYIWLLGDDDMILPGSVESVLSSLRKNPIILFLNTSGLKTEEPLEHTEPRLIEEGDLEFCDRNVFLRKIGIYITFMSGMVLKTDLVREIVNKEQYIGTYFIQSHVALRTMSHDGIYILNTKNCLAATRNISVGYDLYFVWFKQYHSLFTSTAIESGFLRECVDGVFEESIKRELIHYILNYRLSCPDEISWNKQCVHENLPENELLSKVILFLVYCPKPILKVIDLGQRLRWKIKGLVRKIKMWVTK